jgi:hypothetical protein
MRKQAGYTTLELIISIIIAASVFGWISNIVMIVNTEPFIFTSVMVLRLVGIIVFPLGCVMGFIW